jgi:nucleotide-binding universal stress UspA family protein
MPIRTVLCPTDFTPLSDGAVSLATRICQWYGARLLLEHNLDARPPSLLSVEWMWSEEQKAADGAKERAAEERLLADVERLAKRFPCEARLTRGPLELGLVAVARALPVELVVMGSHGWSDARHHSLTERMLETSPCPLLTLSHESQADRFLSASEAEPIPVLVPLDPGGRPRPRRSPDPDGQPRRGRVRAPVHRPDGARDPAPRCVSGLVRAAARAGAAWPLAV